MRKKSFNFWSYLSLSIILSAFIGFAVSVMLSCGFAALIFYVLKDMGLSAVFAAISLAVGAYAGSYICGKYRRHRGLFEGILCSLALSVFLLIMGTAIGSDFPDIKKFLLLTIFGAAGGVSGVNSKRPLKLMD